MVTARELLDSTNDTTTVTPDDQGVTARSLLDREATVDTYNSMNNRQRMNHQLIQPPDGFEPGLDVSDVQMGEHPPREIVQPTSPQPVDLDTASLGWDIPADPSTAPSGFEIPDELKPTVPEPGLYSPEALAGKHGRFVDEYVGPPARSVKRDYAASLGQGIMTVGAAGKSLNEVVYTLTGNQKKADSFMRQARELKEMASGREWGTTINRVEDVKSFKDFVHLAGNFIGKQTPILTALYGAGVLSGPIGGMLVGSALETGFIYGDMSDRGLRGKKEAKTAIAFGTIAGILDYLPVMRVLNRTGYGKKAKGAVVRELVKDGYLLTAGKEGAKQYFIGSGTEGAQTVIERAAIKWIDRNYKVFDAEGRSEIMNAMLGGGFLEGIIGVGTSPMQVNHAKSQFPYIEDMEYQDEQADLLQQSQETATEDILTKKMVDELGIEEQEARTAVREAIDKNKQEGGDFVPASDESIDKNMAEGLAPAKAPEPIVVPGRTRLQKKQDSTRQRKEHNILKRIQRNAFEREVSPEDIKLYHRIREKQITEEIQTEAMGGQEDVAVGKLLELEGEIAILKSLSTEVADSSINDAVNVAQEQADQGGKPLYVVQDSGGRVITVSNKPKGNNFVRVAPQEKGQTSSPTAMELLQKTETVGPQYTPFPSTELPAQMQQEQMGPPDAYVPKVDSKGQIIGKDGEVIGQVLEKGDVGKATPASKRIFSDEQYQQDKKDVMGGSTLSAGIDPVRFAKALRIGAYHLESLAIAAKGKAISFAEWSAKMIADLGKNISPHLDKIWADVNKTQSNAQPTEGTKKPKTSAIAEQLLQDLQIEPAQKKGKKKRKKAPTPPKGPATAEEAAQQAMPILKKLQSGELDIKDVGAKDIRNPGETEATRQMIAAVTEIRRGTAKTTKQKIWKKAKEILANPAERERLLNKIANEQAASTPEEEGAMQILTEEIGNKGFLEGDEDVVMEGLRMDSNREVIKTLHGQILVMSSGLMRQFDSKAQLVLQYMKYVPRSIRESIAKQKKLAKEAQDAGLPGKALKHLNKIKEINNGQRDQIMELRKKFLEWGVDLTSLEALNEQIKNDPRIMFEMMTEIELVNSDANYWDTGMELIRCNLMSAPITPLRNLLSGTYAITDLAAKAALIPLRIGIAKLNGETTVSNSTWKELPALWQAITSRETWARSIEFAKLTAMYGQPALELMTGNLQNSKNVYMYNNPAMNGKFIGKVLGAAFGPLGGRIGKATGRVGGKIVRGVGMRPSAVGDQFVKTAYSHAVVAMAAARFAQEKNLALDGKAFKEFVQEQMHDMDSVSWERAIAEGDMYRVTFQAEGDAFEQSLMKARNFRILGMKPAQLIVPFLKTPYQLTKLAIGNTVLGVPKMGIKGLRSAIDEKHYSAQEAVTDLGEVVTGLMMFAVAASLLDDDRITPTRDYRQGKRKEANTMRPIKPPGSIRLFGQWHSYENFGPHSTALGITVNTASAVKELFQRLNYDTSKMDVDQLRDFNKKTNNLWKGWVSRTTGVIYDQSFMKGIGNLVKAVMDTETYGDKFLQDLARMAIPNLWSATFRATDKKVRNMRTDKTKGFLENLSQSIGYSTGTSETVPPPVTDCLGEDIERVGDSDLAVFMRSFCSPSITRAIPTGKDYDALRMVDNWNKKHIDDRTWFSEMQRGFPAEEKADRLTKPAIILNKQEIYDMHKLGGKLFAEAFLNNYSTYNIKKPTIGNMRSLRELKRVTAEDASSAMKNIKLLESSGQLDKAQVEYNKLRVRSQLVQGNVEQLRKNLK